MPYNSENGIISAPVSIDDVKQALGESSNDLATLCKSNNINMWSKYKPIIYGELITIDDYRFKDADYGLNVNRYIVSTTFPTLNDIKSAYDKPWTYNKPYGTISSPYRLTDFNGYSVKAKAPLYVYIPKEGLIYNSTTSISTNFYINIVINDDNNGNITINDFGNYLDMSKLKIVAAITYSNGYEKTIVSTNNNILDNNGNVVTNRLLISMDNFNPGLYYVYICLLGKTSSNNTYLIPFPTCEPIQLIVTTSSEAMFILAEWSPDVSAEYKLSDNVYKEGNGTKYSMSNDNGRLYCHIRFKNISNSSYWLSKDKFTISTPYKTMSPNTMWESKPSSDTTDDIDMVYVPKNGIIDLWFSFWGIFNEISSGNPNNTVDISLRLNGNSLSHGSLYYYVNGEGVNWTKL